MDIFIAMMQKRNMKNTGIKSINRKLICLIFLVIIIIISMTSCFLEKANVCDIIVEYNVPFAEPNTRWNEVLLVEKDEFARELYCYRSEGSFTNVFSDFSKSADAYSCVNVYLIVQKTDKDYVYCYNKCYAYVPSIENDNSSIIEELKENNDWNNPINSNKLLALSKKLYSNVIQDNKLVFEEEEIINAFEKHIGCEINAYYLDCIFSVDGTPIYIIRIVEQWLTQTTKNIFGDSYVFCVSNDYSEVIYQKLSDDVPNWNNEISSFSTNQAQKTGAGSMS